MENLYFYVIPTFRYQGHIYLFIYFFFFLLFGGPSEQFDIYEESIYSYKVDLISIYHPNLFSERFSIICLIIFHYKTYP